MRRPLCLAIIFLLLLAGCSAPPTPAAKAEPLSKVIGAWSSKLQFLDGPFSTTKDLELLYSINEGGTMTESSNYDGAPPVPPAYGIWRQTGANQYEARYTFYCTKPPTPRQEEDT